MSEAAENEFFCYQTKGCEASGLIWRRRATQGGGAWGVGQDVQQYHGSGHEVLEDHQLKDPHHALRHD